MSRAPRIRAQLPSCYYEGFLEKRSLRNRTSRKLWAALCGDALFFFNNSKDCDYVEKQELSNFGSLTDDPSLDGKLDVARLRLQDDDIYLVAPSLEARELWKGFILSVVKRQVPTSLNLLPGQVHMLRDAVEKEKERLKEIAEKAAAEQASKAAATPDTNHYIIVPSDMPACFCKLSRIETEFLLEKHKDKGNLLLRPSRDGTCFAVTTRQEFNGPVFQHYRITRIPDGGFAIAVDNPIPCKTLHDVINYLIETTGGTYKPLVLDHTYEENIVYVDYDEENGEKSMRSASSPVRPKLPPKPARPLTPQLSPPYLSKGPGGALLPPNSRPCSPIVVAEVKPKWTIPEVPTGETLSQMYVDYDEENGEKSMRCASSNPVRPNLAPKPEEDNNLIDEDKCTPPPHLPQAPVYVDYDEENGEKSMRCASSNPVRPKLAPKPEEDKNLIDEDKCTPPPHLPQAPVYVDYDEDNGEKSMRCASSNPVRPNLAPKPEEDNNLIDEDKCTPPPHLPQAPARPLTPQLSPPYLPKGPGGALLPPNSRPCSPIVVAEAKPKWTIPEVRTGEPLSQLYVDNDEENGKKRMRCASNSPVRPKLAPKPAAEKKRDQYESIYQNSFDEDNNLIDEDKCAPPPLLPRDPARPLTPQLSPPNLSKGPGGALLPPNSRPCSPIVVAEAKAKWTILEVPTGETLSQSGALLSPNSRPCSPLAVTEAKPRWPIQPVPTGETLSPCGALLSPNSRPCSPLAVTEAKPRWPIQPVPTGETLSPCGALLSTNSRPCSPMAVTGAKPIRPIPVPTGLNEELKQKMKEMRVTAE